MSVQIVSYALDFHFRTREIIMINAWKMEMQIWTSFILGYYDFTWLIMVIHCFFFPVHCSLCYTIRIRVLNIFRNCFEYHDNSFIKSNVLSYTTKREREKKRDFPFGEEKKKKRNFEVSCMLQRTLDSCKRIMKMIRNKAFEKLQERV